MITCRVCGTENDNLAVICSACKSFLQTKVDNIDLFGTLWKLVESPRAAFKRIVLSQHKNYVFLLSGLFGVSIVYAVFWFKALGDSFANILMLLGAGLIVGPPLGILTVFASSITSVQIVRALGGKATLKNMITVLAYASAPIIFSLVLVFPLEVAIFGLYFFGNNPPPIVIKPVVYVVLLGIEILSVVWFCLLLVVGTMVATGFSRVRSLFILLSNAGLAGLGVLALRYF
jgi:hypothetical protein